jgi:glycosyltransferase involved in cell wall biosynthesis
MEKLNAKTKISVITPVVNGERYIRETIDSVLSQCGDFELEYIVKDGGSTDNTLDILKEYGDRIKVISCPDRSTEEAIIHGFENSSGEIICWLGADDIYESGTLQTVVDEFKAHPDHDWLYGRCSIINDEGREVRKWITLYKNLIGFFYSRRLLLCENYINQPAVFFKRSLWEKAKDRFMDYHFASDYNLWVNFSEFSKALPVHQYFSRFRRHKGTTSSDNYTRQLDDSIEIAQKHGNSFYASIYRLNKLKTVLVYRLLDKKQ